ncbi:uncharacterized protein [Pyrus communis]|uniref:uncharacterized protein n=1 Tax=Pyrus communis TaxID=23211 RepID=UPI0035C01230
MMRLFKVLLSLRIVLLQKARPICLGLEDFYIHQVYLRLQLRKRPRHQPVQKLLIGLIADSTTNEHYNFKLDVAYVISFFRWFSIGFHSKTQKLRVKTLNLKGMRHLHASQSADVRALTTCSSLILKQSNPLLSPSPSPYVYALLHHLYVVRNYLSSRDLRFSVSKQ